MVSTVTCHQERQTGAPDPTNLLIAMTGYGKLPNPWIGLACSQFSIELFSGDTLVSGISSQERVFTGQGSDLYLLIIEHHNGTARFCNPAITDLFQECVMNGKFYGGRWWNENEIYNLTNLVRS